MKKTTNTHTQKSKTTLEMNDGKLELVNVIWNIRKGSGRTVENGKTKILCIGYTIEYIAYFLVRLLYIFSFIPSYIHILFIFSYIIHGDIQHQ